ncbi:MAG TPA: SRPBCC domain-containing protein [Candidatus Koribacter sp.]|jgi:activator of HSP90 ATPase
MDLRCDRSLQPSRRQWVFQSTAAACAFAFAPTLSAAASEDGILRTAESIHHELTLNASATRIYNALTDSAQFQKMELLSAAMQSMDVKSHPATIQREPGGSFSLFGNYVVGRQLELLTDRRIVQAWRASSWSPGIYSIARFELEEHGSATKLIFDHTGFPIGDAEHLAAGWYANYWEPLRKFLA